MKNNKESTSKQLNDPREFLNMIVYSEMVSQGMTDKDIKLHYKIPSSQFYHFKKEHGLIGMKRGELIDHLQALQSPAKKHTQRCN